MTRIAFAREVPALLKGARKILVVGPAARFSKRLPKILGREGQALLAELAAGVTLGDLGGVASSLSSDGPREVAVGVLPDEGSRYNAPSRAAAIAHVVGRAGLKGDGRSAILLLLDSAEHYLPAANACARAFPLFNLKSKVGEPGRVQLLALDGRGRPVPAGAAVRATAEYARKAAELVDTPPTDLEPGEFARRAKAWCRGLPKVRVREIAGEKLLANGLNAIHAVGRAARSAPRLLIATYAPARAKTHVALVGKGITFDTGGLHIKSRAGMNGMKGDMGGAAAVLGAFCTLVERKVPHKLSLLLCLAENAVGPEALKPDDVIPMHSGRTVEINNTDAEGRLVLGDGVSWAARKLKVDVIFDAATLTGAQMVATGHRYGAVIANDEGLEELLVDAGRRSGDLCHALPFAPEFFRQEFESPIADLKNSVRNRANAQTSCAAEFIHQQLLDTDVRWGHLDMAGPSAPADRATGYGVALLSEAVAAL